MLPRPSRSLRPDLTLTGSMVLLIAILVVRLVSGSVTKFDVGSIGFGIGFATAIGGFPWLIRLLDWLITRGMEEPRCK